jgi:RND family efflux transporter MFP subunit
LLTRVAVPTAVIGGIVALLALTSGSALMPALEVSAMPVIPVNVAGRAPGTAVVQAAGWIEAEPYLSYATALVDGVVAEVLVLEGDRVVAGQPVAQLIGDDALLALKRAEAGLADSEAMFAEAEARLLAAQTSWDNPTESDRAVAAATARVDESRALIGQLKAEIRAGEAELERRRSDHARIAALGVSEAVSDSEVVTARTLMEAQEASVDALRGRVEVTAAQLRREEAEAHAAQENQRLRTGEKLALDLARASLARSGAERDGARAALAEAQLRVDRLTVKAPCDGVVAERFKQPGSKAMLGMDDVHSSAIVSLYDPARLQVRVDVALADAGSIVAGQAAEVVVDVLPGKVFTGTVSRVLHVADISKNTLQAKVSIDAPSELMRPEMLARVRFMSSSTQQSSDTKQRSVLHIPRAALVGDSVWVVENFDGSVGSAARRTVVSGREAGEGWVEIVEGLNPGDVVITTELAELKPGAKVRATLERSPMGVN